MKKTINVLAFPGTNCQEETARALRQAGFDSRPLRWNEDPKVITQSDGLVIAGGFSFEDRGRSGVVAASDPVAVAIREMADTGKPVLGICNGAQVLVETGLVPGFHEGVIEMALSRNRRQDETGILGSGFFHDFSFMKPTGTKCAWTNFEGVLRLPIAHGEGRFIANEKTIEAVMKNGQNTLTYCDKNGDVNEHFPVNPNGSMHNLAAVCNPAGNVMAMMPHPERVDGGQKIFESLHAFFAGENNPPSPPSQGGTLPPTPETPKMAEKKSYPLELYVSLKITDNTEKTLELAVKRVLDMPNLSLSRTVFWGVETEKNPKEMAEKMIASEGFFNENKENALFKIGEEFFAVNSGKLVLVNEKTPPAFAVLAQEKDDILGEEKSEHLQKHMGVHMNISSGVLWEFSEEPGTEALIQSALLGNPVSWELVRR